MCATRPLVRGTVASQRKPIAAENIMTVFAVMGVRMNHAAATERPA